MVGKTVVTTLVAGVRSFRNSSSRLACLSLLAFSASSSALEPAQILILVNKDSRISSQVARMYRELRHIPDANTLSISLGTSRHITPEEYWSKTVPPVKRVLEANPEIRCIVTTAGVPYTIQATDGKDPGAAYDNELAAVLREEPGDPKRRQANPLFVETANPFGIVDPRKAQMVFVARLDGPELKTITRMVEDAIAVEQTGLLGPVFGDSQGGDTIAGMGLGDASIRAAIDGLTGAGFVSKLDMQRASWSQPKGGVGDQAAGAAFYVGWYDLANFQDIFGPQGLARGSIAWHIASQEAENIWDLNSRFWCINLMRRGAAVTLGPAFEPYLQAFPSGGVFIEALLSGLSVAESYWLSLPNVSWAMVLLGDPLYRPFGPNPRPSLIARSYIKEGGNHILEKGETAPLLVLIQSVAPPGSGTPALKATAEPELGLTTASGEVTIPPLKAGETAVIRVPRVTAGGDSTGLFRLRLKIQDEHGAGRAIILEGRVGFSKITGGLVSKTQMFLSPAADQLVSGQPGNSILFDTNTLREQRFKLPAGFVLAGADFSPDGGHVALGMVNPRDKKAGFVISDSKFASTQDLPPGSQFIRWLGKDRVLIKTPQGIVRHSISGLPDDVLAPPEGWPPANMAGNVIPASDAQFWLGSDGKLMIKTGSEAFREVLRGANVAHFTAVANDLSVFGGVDDEKRLWVQRGFDAKPDVVADHVERAAWGPVSHRVVVQDAANRTRVYDGRDGTWIDLGVVSGVQWSPDEERLLYLDTSSQYLSLLTNRRIQSICPLGTLGALARIAFTNDGGRAFLLAGMAGHLDVWEIALPPK